MANEASRRAAEETVDDCEHVGYRTDQGGWDAAYDKRGACVVCVDAAIARAVAEKDADLTAVAAQRDRFLSALADAEQQLARAVEGERERCAQIVCDYCARDLRAPAKEPHKHTSMCNWDCPAPVGDHAPGEKGKRPPMGISGYLVVTSKEEEPTMSDAAMELEKCREYANHMTSANIACHRKIDDLTARLASAEAERDALLGRGIGAIREGVRRLLAERDTLKAAVEQAREALRSIKSLSKTIPAHLWSATERQVFEIASVALRAPATEDRDDENLRTRMSERPAGHNWIPRSPGA